MSSWVIPRIEGERRARSESLERQRETDNRGFGEGYRPDTAQQSSWSSGGMPPYLRVNFLYGPDSEPVTQDEFIQEYPIVGPNTQVSQMLWSEDRRLTEAARSGISMDDYIDLVSIDTRDTENDIVYWNWNDGTNGEDWGLKQYRLLSQYKEKLDPLIIERASVRQEMKRLEDELYGEFYNNA